jgi:erythromycin esterase
MHLFRRALFVFCTVSILSLAQPKPVMEWIRSAAIPLSTPVGGSGFDDLMPLKKVVGDARIVALGEASHGTREFFQLKHRLFEFLVAHKGFSIIALEATMPAAYRLNDFVLSGQGDPAKLAKGLNMYDTQEVFDMILWMREYNKSGKGRIQFAGFDMQDPVIAIENVQRFLARSDPDYLPTAERAVARIRESFQMDSEGRKGVAKEWEEVVAHLESLRPTDGAEWAAQNARIVVQGLGAFARRDAPEAAMASRDASMAANVKWILDQSKAAKIVLWAHNFHVMNGTDPMGIQMMGGRLRKIYGDQMVTFGFAFNQGSFRGALGAGYKDYTVSPLSNESLDATLAASGIPLFALDLRAAPKSGPVAEWLAAEHPTRNVMTGYMEEHPEHSVFKQVVKDRYDALLFVEKTTAARTRTINP